ncbi:MAG: dCTP deaminase [Nanoarchaeota archaeon]|nr:dCTP deaminase [Nanoarchaeota archaeon]
MVVLSDRDIKKYLEENKLIIEGHSGEIDSCSVDLKLSNKFRFFKKSDVTHIDVRNIDKNLTEYKEIKKENFVVIHPRDLIIGSTMESVSIPYDLVGSLDGKSSLGRIGIVIHSTATSIDPGFKGNIALEISNLSSMPVKLWPGMKICRLSFMKLSSESENPYDKRESSKYKEHKGPEESKWSENDF